MKISLLRFFAVISLVFAASHASATTFRYDLTFKDSSGTIVGSGAVTYDPSAKEDLYASIGRYEGARCYDPSRFDCVYFDTWTPLKEFSAEIDGQDVFSVSYTDVWLEGTYAYNGRYQIGGFEKGRWRVGDIYFAETLFEAGPPPPGAKLFETEFSFAYDYSSELVHGTVEMTHVVPGPHAFASLALGLMALVGWRRLTAR